MCKCGSVCVFVSGSADQAELDRHTHTHTWDKAQTFVCFIYLTRGKAVSVCIWSEYTSA